MKTLLFGLHIFLLTLLPLISEAALVQLLSPQKLHQLQTPKIIDARPLEQWQKGHIPGALHFDWHTSTATDEKGVAYRKLASQEIARQLGRLGIDAQSRLVIYGDAGSSWGSEGWICWLLLTLGHVGEIYLLDGGIQAWQRLGKGLSTKVPTNIVPAEYQVNERNDLGLGDAEILQAKQLQLVDTRSFFEWLRGSIPGAVRISWSEFYQGPDHRPLDRVELINLLQGAGIDPNQPVAYYCSGGIRSAYAWTVHELSGLPTALNYEGGIEAWSKLH